MKLNLGTEFQKAEMVNRQVLIECCGLPSKMLIDATSHWLGPLAEMVKISFEAKSA